MAQIPLGAPPRVMPDASPARVVTPNPEALNRSGQAIAGGLQGIANTALREQAQQAQEDQALARVKASNLLLDRETQLRTITTDLAEKARTGVLKHDQLQPAYEEAASKLQAVVPQGLGPAEMENFGLLLKQVQLKELGNVEKMVGVTKIGEAQSDLVSRMDLLGKDAGMPGADPESVIRRMESEDIDAVGRMAYGLEWDARKQGFKDSVYDINATQRINAARDDMGALQQLEHDLTAEDGYYASRLDANRRTVALNSIMGLKTRLENKALALEAKHEASAQRAIFGAQQQVASGIPAPAGYWDNVGQKVRGTTFEGDFNDIIQSENQVQEVLRLPIDKQMEFVQERETQLMANGGTVKDAANLNRMKTAVTTNVKQLQDAPLLFAQARTGQEVQPLDMSSLLTGDTAMISAQLADRATTIAGMRNLYGSGVKMHPLLPQEVATLSGALQQVTPRQQGQVFGMLKEAFGDSQTFQGAMQQIYPDAPVKALAGMIYSKQRDITLQANTFSSDIKASSGDVADTMLTGENILNKSKADRASDGKSSGFPIPVESDFRSEFSRVVGKVFAGRPEAFDVAMQATRAYYTGKAAQEGDVSGEVDTNRMRQAITATIGTPIKVNGGQPVLAPWGMDQDAFLDRAKAAFETEMTKRDMPTALTNNFGIFSLENRTGDSYRVVQGGDYLRDKQGQPIIINVSGGDQ